jgi:hypothetical protein
MSPSRAPPAIVTTLDRGAGKGMSSVLSGAHRISRALRQDHQLVDEAVVCRAIYNTHRASLDTGNKLPEAAKPGCPSGPRPYRIFE